MGSPQLVMMNQANPTTRMGALLPLGQVACPLVLVSTGISTSWGLSGSYEGGWRAVAVEIDDLVGGCQW